ncbi:ran GTPase-activating protein isoform X2 [Sitodiplosis mosellana]|uniref:ran GTPase-activating protein isoform X2 n=1 Tax=Sitodiplosis mosellana TaxID=263140 RepID=UPI0024437A52|nr:ran GTPase-activating protein isoform X2 [Sitodiplosis mosellana]
MAGFNFGGLEQALADTRGSGVSFESQAKKWESEEEAKDLIEAINNCKVLSYLNLEGNTLGVNAAKGIGEALKKHPEFQKALFKDLFTGRMKTEIPPALQSMGRGMIAAGANLTVFDCSDNALGPNGMTGLVELFRSAACYSLQELKLNNCGLGITGGKMLSQALLDNYEASVKAGTPLQLKVFIAGRNRLENEGAKALAQVFAKVQTLEMVWMPQNGIYHPGISALSDAFKLNPNMKSLNLNDNTITSRGAEHLKDALICMQNLEEINFGDCLLKTKGAVILGESLQDEHLALESLILDHNEIGANGGYAIAAAMHNKEQLQTLNLNGNQFGCEAREGIREMLEETQRLNALEEMDEDDSDGESEDEEDEDASGDDEEESDADTCAADDDDDEYLNNTVESANQSINWTLNSTAELNDSSVLFTGTSEQPNTVETFCNTPHPTSNQFDALIETDKLQAFRDYLKRIPEKDYLVHLVFAIVKLSAASLKNQEALRVATELYRDCFEYAQKTNQVARVNNFFLIQLGLLKNEDKTFKPAYDQNACRTALQHAIKSKVFSDDVEQMFNLFLTRFN